jgi:O-antigen/teichoic acid export membrane protein
LSRYSYLMHPYRPRLGLAAWRQLASFSIWSWAISIAIMIRDRVDEFVIGRLLGIAQVGVYSVGAEIGLTPTYELAAPLSRACFSGFASAIRSDADIVSTYLRILASVMLVVLPIGTGLTLVAAPLVILAFGPAWSGAINVVRILGVSGVMLAHQCHRQRRVREKTKRVEAIGSVTPLTHNNKRRRRLGGETEERVKPELDRARTTANERWRKD